MSMERIHKSEFCERELTTLLRAVDRDIEKAEYELRDNGEEYVHILYARRSNNRLRNGGQLACLDA